VSLGKSEIEAIAEAAIDVDDLEAAEAFYWDVLGLEVIGREPGRHAFFRVGDGVLLSFHPEATLKGKMLPPHGARGRATSPSACTTSPTGRRTLRGWRGG
jgi:catechol 2,3-dioxygenase-like lactoylglutathione lyase family enzyme